MITNLNEQLISELERLRAQHGFPGATLAYVLPDGSVGEVSCGFADMETKELMTTKSRMLAASIGKTFVAATVIALAKEGKLNLDDPLSHYLGKNSWYSRLPNSKTITLRHLLTHSSGLPDHVYATSYHEWVKSHPHFIPEALIECILDRPPLFEAGKGWAYTDTGYILLGLVIENVTHTSYYAEVMRRFLKPLKLDQTSPSDRKELPGLVAGYTDPENILESPRKTTDASGIMVWDPVIEWTGGGLISTSHDLAAWAKLLYEGQAMPYDYLGDLFNSVPKDDSGVRVGAGVLIQPTSLGPKVGHGGFIPGYTSSMRYYPEHRVAVAFQLNTDIDTPKYVGGMEQSLAEIVIRETSG